MCQLLQNQRQMQQLLAWNRFLQVYQALKHYQVCSNDDPRLTFDQSHSNEQNRTNGPLVLNSLSYGNGVKWKLNKKFRLLGITYLHTYIYINICLYVLHFSRNLFLSLLSEYILLFLF